MLERGHAQAVRQRLASLTVLPIVAMVIMMMIVVIGRALRNAENSFHAALNSTRHSTDRPADCCPDRSRSSVPGRGTLLGPPYDSLSMSAQGQSQERHRGQPQE
jgi:hypothetical protein